MDLPNYLFITFLALVASMYVLVLLGVRAGQQLHGKSNSPVAWTGLAMAGWLTFVAVMANSGFFAVWSVLPPRLPIALFLPLVTQLILLSRPGVKRWLTGIPKHWLVYAQSFRILVEIILWRLLVEGLLPIQMTFEGLNFDILAGVFALPVGYLLQRNPIKYRKLGIAYNVLGLVLITTIVTIAVLSFPSPLRVFMNEPANRIVGHFPMVWLPGFLVILAYGFHFFSLKQLLRKPA